MRWKATFFLILAITTTLRPDEIRGKVISIADGDTITILDAANERHRIRLEGIDAPEKGQAFGTRSKELVSQKVGGKNVVIVWTRKDRYSRILGDVILGDRNINIEMVKEGMAWHYKQYSKSEELAEAEVQARQERKGLWADTDPIPPWEFRRRERERTKSRKSSTLK